MCISTSTRRSIEIQRVLGYYARPAEEHHRRYNVYTPSTRKVITTDKIKCIKKQSLGAFI